MLPLKLPLKRRAARGAGLPRTVLPWVLLWVLLCGASVSAVTGAAHATIHEVLFNPAGSDNNKEFIEVVTAEDLSGWVIGDAASNDSLVLVRRNESCGRAVIVEEGFASEGLLCSVYSAGASIGNGLGNSGDVLRLFAPNGSLIDWKSYDGSLAREGYSIVWEGEWRESRVAGGTPCAPEPAGTPGGRENRSGGPGGTGNASGPPGGPANEAPGENRSKDNLSDVGLRLVTSRVENRSNPLFFAWNRSFTPGAGACPVTSADVWVIDGANVLMNESVPVSLCPNESFGVIGAVPATAQSSFRVCARVAGQRTCGLVTVAEPCAVRFSLRVPRIIRAGESITIDPLVEGVKNFSLRYTVSELSGRVLVNRTTRNARVKRYTPRVEYLEAFRVRAVLSSGCGVVNASALVIVQGGAPAEPGPAPPAAEKPVLELTAVDPGPPLTVRFSAQRGRSRKRVVKVWAVDRAGQRVSEVTRIALESRGLVSVTVPVALTPRGGDATSNELRVIVAGLGEREERLVRGVERRGCPPCRPEKGLAEKRLVCALPERLILSLYTRVRRPGAHGRVFARVRRGAAYELLGWGVNASGIGTGETMSFDVPFLVGRNLVVMRARNASFSEERSIVIERADEGSGEVVTQELLERSNGTSGKNEEKNKRGLEVAHDRHQGGEDAQPRAEAPLAMPLASRQAADEKADQGLLTGMVTGGFTQLYRAPNGWSKLPLFVGVLGLASSLAFLRRWGNADERRGQVGSTRRRGRKLFKESGVTGTHDFQEGCISEEKNKG